MTAPAPSGGPSPLRIGGLALLGVGAVAGIIGIATLATGGDGSPSAAPSSTTTASADPGFTPTDGALPPGSTAPTDGVGPGGGVPVPSFGPTPTGEVPAPGAGSGDGGTGSGGTGSGGTGTGGAGGTGAGGTGSGGTGSGGGGAEDVRMPLRVYNNSTIPGLAARGADDFRSAGWTVTETGGYNGRIPTSTVYYRPGTSEQDAADFLASAFGLRAEPRFDGIQSSSPGVIVILTPDYRGA